MLNFRQYLILEQTVLDSKNRLKQMITLSVLQFRKNIKKFELTGIMSPAQVLVLESAKDVARLSNSDLHQTEQNKKAMTKFLNDFEKLSKELQLLLVGELSSKKNEKGYIENNEEVKLILIYNRDKNSVIGQEAYNAVVMNKQGMFEAAAQEKVMKRQLRADQAADYVQEMFLVLCGGGDYNAQNGGANSIDGYDPFSGVPFTSFVKSKVITSAFNKFQAVQNTSVANDYAGYRLGTSIVSTDEKTNKADSDDKDMTIGDFIEDETELGRDPSDLTDEKMKKEMLEKVLNGVDLPPNYQLTLNEVKVIKLVEMEGMSLKEAGIEMGYKKYPVNNVKRIQYSALSKLRKAIDYLTKKDNVLE